MGTMMTDELTGDTLFQADFSEFSSTGSFYVEVPGLGRSATFTVGTDVYNDLLTRAMIGMYGQRCGTDVHITLDGESWGHAACHQHDGSLKYLTGSNQVQASNGGWHDAGDYGKYTTNGAFSAGMMLAAWEQFQPVVSTLSLPIPEHGGALPDFLAEVKWELDWLLTIRRPTARRRSAQANRARSKASSCQRANLSFATLRRSAPQPTGDFTAVTAQAARIHQPYDCGPFPETAGRWASQRRCLQMNTGPWFASTSQIHHGGDGDRNDGDERTWPRRSDGRRRASRGS